MHFSSTDFNNIEALTQKVIQVYNSTNNSWIAFDYSAGVNFNFNPIYAGGAGGATLWKVHISINIDDMEKAIPLVLKSIHERDLKVSFKIATKEILLNNPQPSKEVSIELSQQVLNSEGSKKIASLFNLIALEFHNNGIKASPNKINSDKKYIIENSKYDGYLRYNSGRESNFNYRQEYLCLDDEIWDYGEENCYPDNPVATLYVKKSYFERLPDKQKHNPGKLKDPFEEISKNLIDPSEPINNFLAKDSIKSSPISLLKNSIFEFININKVSLSFATISIIGITLLYFFKSKLFQSAQSVEMISPLAEGISKSDIPQLALNQLSQQQILGNTQILNNNLGTNIRSY